MIIFTNGSKDSLKRLMHTLTIYEQASGQRINLQKSAFYTGKSKQQRAEMIQDTLGIPHAELPFVYLGAPIFKGRPAQSYFEDMKTKMVNRIEGWKARYLSTGGRLTLIKSVLSSMHTHTLSVIKVPAATLDFLETRITNFFWNQGSNERHHWVSWQTITQPTEFGGLGIRSLRETMDLLQYKLAWSYLCGTSLWAKVMRSKYGDPLTAANKAPQLMHRTPGNSSTPSSTPLSPTLSGSLGKVTGALPRTSGWKTGNRHTRENSQLTRFLPQRLTHSRSRTISQ